MTGARTRGASAFRRIAAFVITAALLVGGLSAVGSAASAAQMPSQTVAPAVASASIIEGSIVKTADLSKFQPGNIISDTAFFNRGTMTEGQIQSFLQSRVPTCQSGYVCLKDWYDTSRTTTADAMCGAYSGGIRERASAIIYKVAQACGINPQVLIVMLQKEQGLVTHTWPSDWRYTIAMGQGCPDTAACDTRYYGFFNQVYGAAWQLKRYANPPGTSAYFTWFAPGNTWNVRWHPNESCGSSPVYIQNQATANLYYYTPYQPNAAALRAGYGEGDGCSAYGNRNFYQYYTDWFGSTQRDPAAEIEWEYQAQGGIAGLGAAQSGVLTIAENGGGHARAFAGGSIYWTAATGAKTVRIGPLRDYYFARGGAAGDMGWPALNQQVVTVPTGSGAAQLFTGGSLYSSERGTYIVREPVRAGYFLYNGALGALGWPTSDQACAAGVCTQQFEGGSVVSSASGSFALFDPVRAAFDAAGGVTGAWGVPVSALVSYGGGGFGQAFANGSTYYREGGDAFFVSGAIRSHYFSLGGAAGKLGYPVGAQECASATECRQEFQFGWILWSSGSGARVGAPAIDAAYAALGGPGGTLGGRTGGLVYYSFNGGGFAETFVNGAIFYKPSAGAHAITGPVRDAYFAEGGAAGRFGWPTSDQACAAGVCTQQFEGGSVVSSASGSFALFDPVRAAFDAAGGVTGAWGVPVSALVSYGGGGFGQAFANGSTYYREGGNAFFVSGAIRSHYFSLGGAAGKLGYPVGAQECASATECRQEFQFGWILWSSGSGARVGAPAIDAAYAALGGPGGTLGGRTGGLVYYSFNGGGFAETFVNGAIFYKPSAGAHAITGPVRDAYFAEGGAAGRFGWPTSDQACAAGVCTQQFEGGPISRPS